MKRTHKKSKIAIIGCEDLCNVQYLLQVENTTVGIKDCLLVEYLEVKDAEEYKNSTDTTPEKNIVDMEYENALTTVLNNDPRGQFSGKTLKEIFNAPNGKEWVKWALDNMKNKFIVDRVRAIYNHNNGGTK